MKVMINSGNLSYNFSLKYFFEFYIVFSKWTKTHLNRGFHITINSLKSKAHFVLTIVTQTLMTNIFQTFLNKRHPI